MAISIDKLAAEIADKLASYTGNIAEEVKEAAEETAQELLTGTQKDAPKRTGKYRKAMAVNTISENKYERRKLWYVKAPHYRLQHLLERGHALRDGGRSRAFPHIEKNAEKAEKDFTERVERILENGSNRTS